MCVCCQKSPCLRGVGGGVSILNKDSQLAFKLQTAMCCGVESLLRLISKAFLLSLTCFFATNFKGLKLHPSSVAALYFIFNLRGFAGTLDGTLVVFKLLKSWKNSGDV